MLEDQVPYHTSNWLILACAAINQRFSKAKSRLPILWSFPIRTHKFSRVGVTESVYSAGEDSLFVFARFLPEKAERNRSFLFLLANQSSAPAENGWPDSVGWQSGNFPEMREKNRKLFQVESDDSWCAWIYGETPRGPCKKYLIWRSEKVFLFCGRSERTE